MTKKIGLFLVTGLIMINIYSQQAESISVYLPIDIVNSKDAFWNRKVINPSLSNDTIAIEACLISNQQWLGLKDAPTEDNITLTGRIPKTNSIIGMDLGYRWSYKFKNQILRFNYSYKIDLNDKSDIKTGVNLGFSRYRFDPNQIYIPGIGVSVSNWSYYPNLDLGLTYRRLNQNIGISYLDMYKSSLKSDFSTYDITKRILVINYFSSYTITSSMKVIPELIVYSASHKTNLMLKGNISLHDKLFAGLVFDNSISTFGILISGVVFKYFEIGYIFENVNSANIYSYGSHNLKLGILIK
jgi:type IX secretion system PorP/SprF family membrane protein